ncbi:MAG: HD-GYP domain-containing protein [Ruminococcus sp.]
MSNTTLSKIIRQNECDANKTTARIMGLSFLVFSLIYFLNIAGIFIIDHTAMTSAYFISAVLLLAPLLFNHIFSHETWWLKYLYVVLADLFILVCTTTLTYHVVLIYAYPIAIAGLYFSKRLTNVATCLTIAVTTAGQFFGYYLNWRPDYNFTTFRGLVLFSILPRLLTLICFAALLGLLTNRTSKLLADDAENYEQLIQNNIDMVYGFANLVENRDQNTGGHIKRTSVYVRLIAEELQNSGVYTEEITDEFIGFASTVAPLHDIGKIAIPDSILQKPGKLTDEEFEIMKTHSAKGGSIIEETFSHVYNDNYRKMAFEIARFHHEKWNGRGYPEGRKGEDIPLAARIMSIADVFDAVSEKRCYRDAMPLDQCFDIIEKGGGTDFDPVITEAFLRIRDKITRVHDNNV